MLEATAGFRSCCMLDAPGPPRLITSVRWNSPKEFTIIVRTDAWPGPVIEGLPVMLLQIHAALLHFDERDWFPSGDVLLTPGNEFGKFFPARHCAFLH